MSPLGGANGEHTIEPCCVAECGKTAGAWRCSETDDLGPPWPRAAASHSLGEDEANTRFGIHLVVLRHDPRPHGEHQHNCEGWNISAQRSTKKMQLAYWCIISKLAYSCIISRVFCQNHHHPPTQPPTCKPTTTMQNKIGKTKPQHCSSFSDSHSHASLAAVLMDWSWEVPWQWLESDRAEHKARDMTMIASRTQGKPNINIQSLNHPPDNLSERSISLKTWYQQAQLPGLSKFKVQDFSTRDALRRNMGVTCW